ncbi:Integrase catalytic domain-containing protein [Citrus sinensis]|nr:Integrase catalytic domain-containing protein [Citrus sinensis]KAH9657445.1 Integrase catalytic domain-containing protein [Citrus sinensis]
MQVISSDNGTKYTSEKFNKFCEDAGIEHQLTAPYTPQQNGVVERKNRTIMEMARCLLHDKGLPKKFWAEAVNTAVFLLNRLPTKALQKKTPLEAWLDTIRMLLALAAQQGWVIHQMDVKSAFLNGYLEEEIFVEQPEGFVFSRQDEKVHQKENEIFLSQQKYAKEVLKKFNMEECKPTATPMNQKNKFCKEDGAKKVDERLYRSLIGCLMCLTATRPDIMHAVSLLSSDWAGCVDDMRSTSGYCFSFGSGIFSGCSKKQEVVAQSTAEVEYVATAAAVNQAIWIRKLMKDLHIEQQEGTQIFVDNQAAISIANNPVFHGKTKHFKIKLYFLRDVQREGEVQLIYCKTENQSADILTKALPKIRYEFLRQKLGVCSSRVKEENVDCNNS